MSIVYLAQLVGTITIFLLFALQFYVAVNPRSSKKLLRVVILWTTIYILFLFTLRVLSLAHIGTLDQLRVISGFSSLIPFVAVVAHMWLYHKIEDGY